MTILAEYTQVFKKKPKYMLHCINTFDMVPKHVVVIFTVPTFEYYTRSDSK
jgi:hypothetical protein